MMRSSKMTSKPNKNNYLTKEYDLIFMTQRFSLTHTPPPDKTPAFWFIFRQKNLLVNSENTVELLPRLRGPEELSLHLLRRQFIGNFAGIPCYAAEVAEDQVAPPSYEFRSLRGLLSLLEEDLFFTAGRALQIIHWDRTHQYCGQCGAPTVQENHQHSRRCSRCGLTTFPRLSPAVIVLVTRGREVLLARSPRFTPGMYSTLAGFVEPGESLEECIHREIREEVGVEVANLRYFGSQPWPFPHSLMIGFHAEYAGGDIVVDGEEIEAAGWFPLIKLPPLPPPGSIARKLIEAYLNKYSSNQTKG